MIGELRGSEFEGLKDLGIQELYRKDRQFLNS